MKRHSKINKVWRNKNKEKVIAHWTVSNAIRYGKLKRLPCESCGNSKSEAHHSDYSKPLLIQWLCKKCHWLAHGWISKVKSPDSPDKRFGPRSNTKKSELTTKAVELRESGLSYTEIALELNASRASVFKWINKPNYK